MPLIRLAQEEYGNGSALSNSIVHQQEARYTGVPFSRRTDSAHAQGIPSAGYCPD
jgi:hypothetical protein